MNLVTRTISGAVILAILILITYLGRLPLAIGVTIFSLIALKELSDSLKKIGYKLPMGLSWIFDLVIMGLAYYNNANYLILAFTLMILASLIYMIFSKTYELKDFFALAFAIFYVPILFSNMIRIENTAYVWLLYIISWGTDTFAYLVGSFFGKKKIAFVSHISPNKTLEGSIGGVAGALLLAFLFKGKIGLEESKVSLILFVIIGSLSSQLGDLTASYIKRKAGIKDFGKLIPGHGGILDRYDSMLFVSPLAYLFSL